MEKVKIQSLFYAGMVFSLKGAFVCRYFWVARIFN
jgi:hypothetical protein